MCIMLCNLLLQVIHDICSKMALQYNAHGLPWPWSWLRLILWPPSLQDTTRNAASTAGTYASIKQSQGSGKAGSKGAATLWQLLFGGSESGSDSDTIKAAAGKAVGSAHHRAKPLVTAAA